MKKRVLVFPCGTEIGLEIHASLKWSTHVKLFGASSVPSNHGRFVYKNYLEELPFVDDNEFVESLNRTIRRHQIEFIFPAHDSVVTRLADVRSSVACSVIAAEEETCRVCRSKGKTYELFRGELVVPHRYETAESVAEFPVFLKPDVGEGSRGTVLARSAEDVHYFRERDATLLILEFLPGREFTVDCFTDRFGELRFVGPRERVRVAGGISVDTMPVTQDAFRTFAEIINRRLVMRGAWFFQVKERADGELALLEIAPRIGGAMGLHRNLGVNLPLLTLFDAMGQDVEISINDYGLRMDRALCNRFIADLSYEHVYIDLDDTIVLDGEINPLVMAFLFQCVNRRIGVHLLTKHAGDITETLSAYRMSALFDTVTVIPKDARKEHYIRRLPAIFIDDSFSERLRIKESLGIPVFDVHAVEGLLVWKG